MSMRRTYLDHNATSPLRPKAREAMNEAFGLLGNPSSVHAEGRAARGKIEDARVRIAAHLGTAAGNVIFTSGATEAANLVLTPSLEPKRGAPPFDCLIASAGEHLAVLQGHRFPQGAAVVFELTGEGEASLEALDAALNRNKSKRIMVALQAANNETGVIQPVRDAADMVHAAGGVVICDATQTVGRLETTFAATGADALFFSSHKIGGPAGAGALAFRSDAFHIKEALLRGGGQESGRRAGTENIAAIAGFASALDEAVANAGSEQSRLARLRDEIEGRVLQTVAKTTILGAGAPRLYNCTAFVTPGAKAQTLLMALDLEGVAVSSGSACSAGKVRGSHVLEAMGVGGTEALRISLGWSSTEEDVESFGTAFARVVERIRLRQTAA
jgi:cysteine desulfurase